jgi:hypothetical protein
MNRHPSTAAMRGSRALLGNDPVLGSGSHVSRNDLKVLPPSGWMNTDQRLHLDLARGASEPTTDFLFAMDDISSAVGTAFTSSRPLLT